MNSKQRRRERRKYCRTIGDFLQLQDENPLFDANMFSYLELARVLQISDKLALAVCFDALRRNELIRTTKHGYFFGVPPVPNLDSYYCVPGGMHILITESAGAMHEPLFDYDEFGNPPSD